MEIRREYNICTNRENNFSSVINNIKIEEKETPNRRVRKFRFQYLSYLNNFLNTYIFYFCNKDEIKM